MGGPPPARKTGNECEVRSLARPTEMQRSRPTVSVRERFVIGALGIRFSRPNIPVCHVTPRVSVRTRGVGRLHAKQVGEKWTATVRCRAGGAAVRLEVACSSIEFPVSMASPSGSLRLYIIHVHPERTNVSCIDHVLADGTASHDGGSSSSMPSLELGRQPVLSARPTATKSEYQTSTTTMTDSIST